MTRFSAGSLRTRCRAPVMRSIAPAMARRDTSSATPSRTTPSSSISACHGSMESRCSGGGGPRGRRLSGQAVPDGGAPRQAARPDPPRSRARHERADVRGRHPRHPLGQGDGERVPRRPLGPRVPRAPLSHAPQGSGRLAQRADRAHLRPGLRPRLQHHRGVRRSAPTEARGQRHHDGPRPRLSTGRAVVIAVNSLRLRLLPGAVVWIVLALAAAGTLLAALFRAHVERRLEAELTNQLEQIAAALDRPGTGQLILSHQLNDPRFRKPYSGVYWQVEGPDGPIFRSRSLWDVALRLHPDASADGGGHRRVHRHRIAGPDGQRLIALERTVTLPDAPGAYRVVTATDEKELTTAAAAFTRTLVLSLGVIAFALAAAAAIQVQVGLRPLHRLRVGVAAIREGRIKRLAGPFPTETQPLVEDLNALLQRNEEVVARGRTQAGNLAHGLKTPLSVLANEVDRLAADGAPQLAASMRGQIATMRQQIDYQLARARAAASLDVPGARVPVAPSVAAIQRTLEHLHVGRDLQFVTDIPAGHVFRGEQQDLEEMLGNLMDNACKWARRRVVARSRRDDGRLTITVEDDGPGLPAEQLPYALAPGARFDEKVPGTGLGLAIVRDLASLYSGSIALGRSSLGGLQAALTLPAG